MATITSEYIWNEWSTASASTSTSTTSFDSSAGTWQYWNTTSTSASTITTDSTWDGWVNGSVPSDQIYVVNDCEVWSVWVNAEEDSATVYEVFPKPQTYRNVSPIVYGKNHVPFRKTTEQIRAEKTQREINRIWSNYKYEEMQAEKEAAEEVALEMLGDLIGDDQLKVYRETGRLLVHGKNHDWLLRKGGIIAKVEKGKLIDHCVHLARRGSYPPTDNVITLALRLKDDDKEVEKIANRHAQEKSTDELLRAANY